MPQNFLVLGTDGYGLSESRETLRDYFEISSDHVCHAALVGLLRNGSLTKAAFKKHTSSLHIDADKMDPMDH